MYTLDVYTNELTLYYDVEQCIRHIIYGERHTDELVQRVFCWTIGLYQTVGAANVRGAVGDYRHITHFEAGILPNIRRRSKILTQRYAPCEAIAIIVANLEQEQMARMTIHMSGLQHACVVRSVDEAVAFINRVHTPQHTGAR